MGLRQKEIFVKFVERNWVPQKEKTTHKNKPISMEKEIFGRKRQGELRDEAQQEGETQGEGGRIRGEGGEARGEGGR